MAKYASLPLVGTIVKSLLIKCQKRIVPVLDDWCQSMGAKEEADPDALQNQPVLGIRVPLSC